MNSVSSDRAQGAEPVAVVEDLAECSACEGSGWFEYGECGSYYRDGEKYDAPGREACEQCNGKGIA